LYYIELQSTLETDIDFIDVINFNRCVPTGNVNYI